MSKLHQTVPTPRISSVSGTRRRSRGSRLMALALATLAMSGATIATPQATRAASTIGDYGPAHVVCNSVRHELTITPRAGAAPGLASQVISYRYWLLDRSADRYVAGWSPSPFGTIRHDYQYTVPILIWGGTSTIIVAGPVWGAPSVVGLAAGHSYSVYTEYWWPTGGRWYSAGIWTQGYATRGYAWQLEGQTQGSCQL